MMKGNETSFSNGFTNAVTRPRISATTSSGSHFSSSSAVPCRGPVKRMPSTSQAATARAMALVISQVTKRMPRS